MYAVSHHAPLSMAQMSGGDLVAVAVSVLGVMATTPVSMSAMLVHCVCYVAVTSFIVMVTAGESSAQRRVL